MSREYTITQFKIGDFQDNYGNTWCDMALQGEGEPVRIVVKDPLQYKEGMVLYGDIKEHESKAGNTYQRFHKADREDGQQSFVPSKPKGDKPDEAYWADKQAQIKAQWAIGQAVSVYKGDFAAVISAAKELYKMVDIVKGQPVAQSGYETAKAVRATLPERVNEDENVEEEYAKVVERGYGADDINLNDIPF